MRPRYCTEQDRKNEAITLARFTQFLEATAPQHRWRCEPTPNDPTFDGKIFKDDVLSAIVEIKHRKGDGDYEDWFVGQHKVNACRYQAASLGCKFIFIMAWSEGGMFFIDGKDIPNDKIKPGGRYDRGDSLDEEMMQHIPIPAFQQFA